MAQAHSPSRSSTSTPKNCYENKWILFTVALVLIAINLLNADFSAYEQLSAVDLFPVIVIALVSFLIKTGVLSAAVIGIKKLWEWFRKK